MPTDASKEGIGQLCYQNGPLCWWLRGYSGVTGGDREVLEEVMSRTGEPSPGTAALAEKRRLCLWMSPWIILLCALVLKACVISSCMVTLLKGNPSCEVHKALPQGSAEWHCIVGRDEGKGRVWTCCPLGWEPFHTSCYYFSKDIMNWGNSEKNCSGMGSHLVVINTEAEQDFISNYVKRTVIGIKVENYLIGLTQEEKGQWHWVDRTPYNETAAFWIPGEPNLILLESCVAVDTSQKKNRNWNNFNCVLLFHRICETAATSI
ncbi:C-type lectin domain family 4 member E-like [Emydura macquarii macquarii]|uniref:C-type lectin domain family 4 member E-like n=1 Tax=Emydura macquarii macquarii TaxID=1129001 RepID=UPI00352B273F